MDGTVTLASRILRQRGKGRQGDHPWMLHGWHSNSGIHGYLDREGRGGKVAGHSWMLHGWHSNSGIHGYLDREGRGGRVAIHGWSMDGTVTLASTDT